jgi:predicted O-methyltransferase YrrM
MVAASASPELFSFLMFPHLVRMMFREMANPLALKVSDIASHLPTLYTLAKHWSHGYVVELGVGQGFSTLALLAGVIEGGCGLISYDNDSDVKNNALKVFGIPANNWEIKEHWEFRVSDSTAAAADFGPETVSLLFIDTLHTYEKTKEELAVWLSKIHPQGIICGHDYYLHLSEEKMWATLSGVHTAVDEFAKAHSDRFELQVFPNDRGLFIFWPRT